MNTKEAIIKQSQLSQNIKFKFQGSWSSDFIQWFIIGKLEFEKWAKIGLLFLLLLFKEIGHRSIQSKFDALTAAAF